MTELYQQNEKQKGKQPNDAHFQFYNRRIKMKERTNATLLSLHNIILKVCLSVYKRCYDLGK